MWVAVIATVIIGALLYKLFLSPKKDHWKGTGVREIDTSPALGTLDLFMGRKNMSVADDYAYKVMGSDKFCGMKEMSTPMLLVKDLELTKKILIKDFDHFMDRRPFFTEFDGVLHKMVFNMEGDEWKSVRSSVSATFTAGKVRRMMEHFNAVGKEWVAEYNRKASANNGAVTVEIAKSVNQFTIEVISTAVFGMNANAIKNPETTFLTMANKFSEVSVIGMIKLMLGMHLPRLGALIPNPLKDVLQFFKRILEQGLESRMKGETKRNDFLQMLVEAKKGELKTAGADELSSFEKDAVINGVGSSDSKKQQYLTQDVLVANCIQFFFDGYGTIGHIIVFSLYALALHPEMQDRAREEVDKIFKEDGSLDYEDVADLTYVEMVICEVLRMFPAAERLERVCVKEYNDPENSLKVPKGTLVGIPVNGIHHDKQYYDNPDKFDPEHFSAEKKAARTPYAYLPFGMGPRNCLGMRFAQIEMKTVIAYVIHNFIVEPTAKTPVPLQGRPGGISLFPPSHLELKLTSVKSKK